MARVTVEDCVQQVPNRFELVNLAAQRAKTIATGAPLTIDRDKDKNAVIALREIALGTIDVAKLREMQITNLQKHNRVESILDENLYAEAKEDAILEVDYQESIEEANFSHDEDFGDDISEVELD